jgi:ubiquinone/menaquinone biosynthesis C-methylase UbiE
MSGMGRAYLKQIKILEKLVSEKRVLDIGCGVGIFLAMAKKEGWETYGVDESEHASYFAEKNFNIKYHQSLSSFPGNSMSVIRISHVMEHSTEPDKLFAEISRIIKPSGTLVVIVPNCEPLCEMFINKLRVFMSSKPELAGSMYPNAHILGFNTKTLSIAAKQFGFKAISLFTTSMGDNTYYPIFFDGLLNIKRLNQISPASLLRYWIPIFANNLGNRFNRGCWIVGYFKKDEK